MRVEEEIRGLSQRVLAASVDADPDDARAFRELWPAACAAHRSLATVDAELCDWGGAMSDAAEDGDWFPDPPPAPAEHTDLAIGVFAALGAGLQTCAASAGWLNAALALPATTPEAVRAQAYARRLLAAID